MSTLVPGTYREKGETRRGKSTPWERGDSGGWSGLGGWMEGPCCRDRTLGRCPGQMGPTAGAFLLRRRCSFEWAGEDSIPGPATEVSPLGTQKGLRTVRSALGWNKAGPFTLALSCIGRLGQSLNALGEGGPPQLWSDSSRNPGPWTLAHLKGL